MFRSSVFDRCLEKATSQLLLEPDWESTMKIVDAIRQNDVQPKIALLAIRKKIALDNPHVASYALGVLETCVKNCGTPFHQEVATKEFMEFLMQQATIHKRTGEVNNKILELIQAWAHAFRNEPSYKVVEDTYHMMKMAGQQFPTLKEADAMFMSEKAPEWKDGETCTRCRVQFGMVQRKHHCRNCGEVFCNKCSTKTSIIPKFGIEREVRVCDSCFDKLSKPGSKKEDGELPAEYLASPLSKQSQNTVSYRMNKSGKRSKTKKNPPQQRSEQEIAEEEELQLALALSRSEAESKEKEYWRKESEVRERLRKNYGVYGGGSGGSQPAVHSESPQPTVIPAIDTSDMDPELARYLNRNYWQKRSEEHAPKTATTMPSAPSVSSAPQNTMGKTSEPSQMMINSEQHLQNGEQAESDKAQFLAALQSSLEIFVNRMRSNSQRGRPIANDSSVQSLFTVISNMHPQLLKYQQEMEDSRSYFEGLQDKLTQLRDAREALDSLRDEHREKRRREMEEMERQRQIQMMQKLEVMRQKKHEYLEMQRQLALQRLQEQEREMAMRLEQQKQLTHMRQMQHYGYPQMYGQQPMSGPGQSMMGGSGMMPPQQGMPPSMGGPSMVQGYAQGAQSAEGSPVHQLSSYSQHMPPSPQQQQQQQPPGIEGQQGPGGPPGPMQGPQGMLQGPPGPPQGPGPQSQGMYMAPGTSQGTYSQAPAGSYTPQMSTIPSGYQPPAPQGQAPPPAQQSQLDGGQLPAGSTAYIVPPASMGYTDPGLPSMGQPSMAFTSMPPTMDYSSFNMQSIAQNLPQQQTQGGGGGGMYSSMAGQQPAPGQQQPYIQNQYPPSNISNNQMPAQQMPPQQQQQQRPQESLLDAQLISFD